MIWNTQEQHEDEIKWEKTVIITILLQFLLSVVFRAYEMESMSKVHYFFFENRFWCLSSLSVFAFAFIPLWNPATLKMIGSSTFQHRAFDLNLISEDDRKRSRRRSVTAYWVLFDEYFGQLNRMGKRWSVWGHNVAPAVRCSLWIERKRRWEGVSVIRTSKKNTLHKLRR